MSRLKIGIMLIAGSLLLSACGDPNEEKICKEHGEVRPCTQKEQMMIDDMRLIIRHVREYALLDKKEMRWVGRTSKKNVPPKVIFFGETHPEIIGRTQTLGEINRQLRPGDILLLEGGDWRIEPFNDCGINVIFDIFSQWQYEKLGGKYFQSLTWKKKDEFAAMLETTRESYDLTGLNIANLRCGFWDDSSAVAASIRDKTKVGSLVATRNQAMVNAIEHRLKSYNRVIINTGAFHMPFYEYEYYKHLFTAKSLSFPDKRSDFYPFIEQEKKKSSLGEDLGADAGSTRVIYEYLKRERIPYQELIHGKVLRQ